ncbi:MAG TPA: type II toxin-antitoxin system Phd/YefM family antitoxin [Candidatus Sulfotelmatobacter sp.]|nr:type II toxin-antitoxin system Phd/YefM family antitoxin [Candidatus Sulfotelmatobacter sp.]
MSANWRLIHVANCEERQHCGFCAARPVQLRRLLRRVADERRSLVIEKRGTPKAVLLSIRDYVRLAAPEPEVLRLIGEDSRRKGTSALTSRQIDQVIKASRAQQSARR